MCFVWLGATTELELFGAQISLFETCALMPVKDKLHPRVQSSQPAGTATQECITRCHARHFCRCEKHKQKATCTRSSPKLGPGCQCLSDFFFAGVDETAVV